MADEKRLISVGDVLYIIGKYSFSPAENPQVVEAQVSYKHRGNFYAYPTNNHGTFKVANSDIGKTAFYKREDAERILRRYLDASD